MTDMGKNVENMMFVLFNVPVMVYEFVLISVVLLLCDKSHHVVSICAT